MMMRKLIFCTLLAFVVMVGFAQSAQQMQQLQNLTPAQMEQLKKMYGESADLSKLAPNQNGSSSSSSKLPQSNQRERQYNDPRQRDNQQQTGNQQNPLSPKAQFQNRYRQNQAGTVNPGNAQYPGNQRHPAIYDEFGRLIEPVLDSVLVSGEEFQVILDGEKKKDRVFGREIFLNENLTFAPSMSLATPPSYVLSAGDQLIIQLWGSAEATYEPKVSPEGNITIPSVGLVNVAGLTISEAERRIKAKVSSTVAGLNDGNVHIKITLGDIRSINVNIVGEAQVPGTYTLPSLSTLFNALYAAGGVSDIGSLRNIKLYRAGKELASLDVYDYLLRGRNDVDMRLEDNDMIVVAPYENIVTISGKTKRPLKYETKRGETVQTLIDYAGGFTGDAYRGNVSLSRRAGGRQYTMHTVEAPAFAEFVLMDRDSIDVGEIVHTYANRVTIEGAVWRKGDFELTDSLATAGALVRAAEGLSPDAFGGRAQILRTLDDGSLQLIPLNVAFILSGKNPDVPLKKNDRLIVTSLQDLREGQNISVKGEVNMPMMFPYAEGMTLQDVILLAKGLKSSASLSRIEVARRISNPNATQADNRRAQLHTFAIASDLSMDANAESFELMPFDEVYIRRSPGYVEQQNIWIDGEVNFPGEYTMATSSDRLTDMIKFAGGFTPQAYVKGASLQRRITEIDLQRIKALKTLMESSRKEKNEADTTKKEAQHHIGDYYPVGIDLAAAMSDPSSASNLMLRDGDILIIPTFDNTVKISGAVYYPTTTTYDPDLTLSQYVKRAGGYTDRALRQPFIIYMNGNVGDGAGSKKKIEPGCEIVIPFRRYVEPMTASGWIGISSSIVSMAAMITSLLNK